ncbi:hypothetical protein [Paenibacillus rhizosphaerae]|uniref:hypothetical protein n=1 Tax=Paenibacillus rhizosphaerae TaxID=297318 RepID=UPI001613D932|nr:hypothetical protein [Paenibacillus rhizosphaerae]
MSDNSVCSCELQRLFEYLTEFLDVLPQLVECALCFLRVLGDLPESLRPLQAVEVPAELCDILGKRVKRPR